MKFSTLVIPGIAMIAVTYGLARFSFGLFLPEITESLGISDSTAGIVSSLLYVSYCLSIIYSTLYSIKHGPKAMIIAAGLSALSGLIIMGLAPNVWILSLGVLLAGSSTGLVSPPFGLAISLWIQAVDQSKANTWINSGTSIGLMFTGLSTLLLPMTWREVYLVYAVLALIVILLHYMNLPKFNKNININTGSFNFRDIKGSGMIASASILLGISTAPFWTFSKSFVESLEIYNNTELSIFWTLIGIFGIIGGISGSIIDKWGLAPAYKSGIALISSASIILALSSNLWILPFISSSIFGLSYIFLTGTLLVWGITLFAQNASLGIGLPFLLLALGQVFGSSIGGFLAESAGYEISFGLFGLIGFLAILISPKKDPLIRTPKDYDYYAE